jgi:predicted DsbA family dithiol-disulfide isomerase
MPAFEAAWCAARQGDEAHATFDLRVRRAFFAEGRNIGRWDVLHEIAAETDLDRQRFEQDVASDAARPTVIEEAGLGRERYRVRGTPTLMLSDGTKLRHLLAYPDMEERQIVAITPLPCAGQDCLDATRAMIEQALSSPSAAPD